MGALVLAAPLVTLASGSGQAVSAPAAALGTRSVTAAAAAPVRAAEQGAITVAHWAPSWSLMRFRLEADAVSAPTTTTTTTTAPAPTTTTTTAPPPAPTTTSTAPAPPPTTTTTTSPPPPPTTTTTTPPPPAPTNSGGGLASWYPEAPDGMCASPTLAFGTVLTVTNDANGARTTCTVDDREGDTPGRVVDLSYDGFSQIADPSQGVVPVTLTW